MSGVHPLDENNTDTLHAMLNLKVSQLLQRPRQSTYLRLMCNGTTVVRTAVCATTALWGALIWFWPNAMDPSRFMIYSSMVAIAHENVWGASALVLAVVAFWRVLRRSPRHWVDGLLYGAFAMLWTYIGCTALLYYPLFPTLTPCVVVVAAMSLFAFVVRDGFDPR